MTHTSPSQQSLASLFGYFYPIHYRIGMELERRTCRNALSRQQAAILWLIEAEVGLTGWMLRKDLDTALHDWFSTSKSQVTFILKSMADPPLALIVQKDNPDSGREKIVSLTDAGRTELKVMTEEAQQYFQEILSHLTDAELQDGIKFLAKAFGPPVRPQT